MLLHELACRLPPLDIDTFLHHSLTHPSSRYRLSACRRLAATSINTEKGRPFCIKLFVERFSSSFSLIKFFFSHDSQNSAHFFVFFLLLTAASNWFSSLSMGRWRMLQSGKFSQFDFLFPSLHFVKLPLAFN